MKNPRRYAIWIGGGILSVLLLVWIIAFVIISLKKDTIGEMATRQINQQVKGTVEIGDLSPNFLRTFPNISVRLSDVSIRDSLWNEHHQDFLKADKIYISIQLLSLVTGKPKIGKVIVENASIHLFTDEHGNVNLNPTDRVSFSQGKSDIPEFRFYQTRIVVENQFLNSYHDMEATYLDCEIEKKDTIYDMHIELNALVHSMGFNMAKGSFLKEKLVKGDFHLAYFPKNKISLDDIVLEIDHHPFTIRGDFLLHTDPVFFQLKISTENILYRKASGLLTEALRQKTDAYDILQPFNASVELAGVLQYKAQPGVKVLFSVEDADMRTTLGDMSHCTFRGSFDNQVDSLGMPGDTNSKFTFENISAEWSGMAVTSTLLEIENLLNPYLKCHLQSSFALQDLNTLTESSTINFIKGDGILDVNYSGSIGTSDTLYPTITGSFSMSDAEFRYIPRDLLFHNGFGSIEFKDEDVIINNLSATAGNTKLTMTGKLINMLALFNQELDQPTMEWNVSTPELNLNDFIAYVRPRQQINKPKKTYKNKMIKAAESIDRFLQDGTVMLHIEASRLMYKNFAASDVKASVSLVENKILFEDVSLNHGGGKAFLKGSLVNGRQSNQLTLVSTIDRVNIPALFKAFDNFGQDAVTYANMKGSMSAKINMTGIITDKATVAESSMKGTVDFSIRDGELNNFEPAVRIAATAFKKRDFSQIQFGELKNRLFIDSSAIRMERMEIRSNVVVLFAEGVYDTKKGTDMSIQVPLSNLSKEENEITNTGKVGLNVRLRAKTGDDGKLAVSWDPFNNASKDRKEDAEDKAEEEDKAKEEAKAEDKAKARG